MSGTAPSVIKLSPEEFSKLQPLNGHIIVRSSQDMTKMTFKQLVLEVDIEYKPENHQEIFNIVEKVPPNGRYESQELRSDVAVLPGDRVIINYFPILQAPVILVGDVVYRMVPYCWVILIRRESINPLDGKKKEWTVMCNDFLMVDKIPLPQSELELEIHKVHSKLYYEVIVANRNEGFSYLKRSNSLLWPVEEDVVTLRDIAVFPLESDGHLYLDGKKHYVAKAWKVLSIVMPEKP